MGKYGYINLLGVNKAVYKYVPYNGATKNVNLGNYSITAHGQNLPLFNGACQIPTITDNGNGSVTIGTGDYHLATEVTGHETKVYTLSGGTFTLTNDAQNYIVADYNSGSPLVKLISDVTLINETTIVPVYSIYRNGNFLHTQNWDALGLALANKVHQSIVKTQRYRRESGLALSVSGTRNLNLTVGRVWTGAVPISLDAIATATDNLYFWHHTGGNWTSTVTTQFPNTQYDNGTDLVTLTPNRYAVIWAFRGVESQKHLYCVVGTGDYTLTQAEAATLPATPTAINSHAMLVGKIIVQNGTNTPTSVQSAFDTTFGLAPIQNHGDLTGRDVADSHPAGAITYTPYSTTTATTVATAINELTDEKEPIFSKGDLKTGTPALTVTNGTARLVGGTATISIASGYTIPTDTQINSFIQAPTISGTTLGLTGTSTTVTIPTPSTCSITTSVNAIIYGALYNWYAATDSRNIAASGWHLPSFSEQQTLETYLGGSSVAGGKLKDTGFTYWNSPNTGADNSSFFNARGAGTRDKGNGSFSSLKASTNIVASTEVAPNVRNMSIVATSAATLLGNVLDKKTGFSVRLIKDATTLTNGQAGTYTGNDGRVYRTICIGTQEWLADNLVETKYRDGSTIPIVTDNSAWGALTTGAMCYYNNDINNAVGTVSSTLCNDLTNLQTQIDSKEPILTKGNLTESITGLSFSDTRQVIGGSTTLTIDSGYLIPTTASATTWDSGYNNQIASAAFSGTTTKTLTLTKLNGGTVTSSFVDSDNQTLSTTASGTTRTVTISGGNSVSIDVADNDNSTTNEIQAPTLVGDNIGLTQTTTTISIAGKEDKSNKVASISESSTDVQYPSAKLVYDQLALKAPSSSSVNYIQNQSSSALNQTFWLSNTVKIPGVFYRNMTYLPSTDVGSFFLYQREDGACVIDFYGQKNILTINKTEGATATPSKFNLGNDYSNGNTKDKLKLYLYNDGIGEQYGFGTGSNGDIQYHSNVLHEWYINNTKKVSISSNGLQSTKIGVGISPSNKIVQIQADSNGEGVQIDRYSTTTDDYASIFFGVTQAPATNQKGGIFFQRKGGNGLGSLILAVNSTNDGTSVTPSDAALIIDQNKNISATGSFESSKFKLSALNTAPSSATDTGITGEIRITSGYIYVCTATNTWVRASLATW
ncbi:MAG: FISUMP domain-containing protein [Bacillota bacterium]